jgi:hypothetical protein
MGMSLSVRLPCHFEGPENVTVASAAHYHMKAGPMKFYITAILATTATVAAVAGGVATASAASTACIGNPQTSFCGSQVNVYGNALTVLGKPVANARVFSEPSTTKNGSQDFIATQPIGNPNPDARNFEFAPFNKRSHLCLSQPATNAKLFLRPCNGNVFQTFLGVNPSDTTGTQWTNKHSGQKIMAFGVGKQVQVVTNPAANLNGSYWGFDQKAVIPVA